MNKLPITALFVLGLFAASPALATTTYLSQPMLLSILATMAIRMGAMMHSRPVSMAR